MTSQFYVGSCYVIGYSQRGLRCLFYPVRSLVRRAGVYDPIDTAIPPLETRCTTEDWALALFGYAIAPGLVAKLIECAGSLKSAVAMLGIKREEKSP